MTYHPHGTSAGQIGHNANIDTGLTPGSDGGKFIGFGEDGTSSIGNRAHWALSENIDHVYQEVHREIAIPKGYNRTAGAVESSFQFPSGEEIWTGDTTYPGVAGTSDPEGMQMLFDVLDSNYNELTDSSDNEIRVGMVKESAGVTDIYQGEFQDQPRIYFVAVDPLTGVVVTDPYTIPAATNYKVMCGIKSTVAELPADALIRYKVQGASEVEAGTFLQDGSRAMTGDLDIDGNNILNVDVLSNVTSEPLDITSDGDLLFKDQYLATSLALSESGQTALYQPVDALVHPSLVGAVNANSEAQEIMLGNRCMDKTGSISVVDEDITYPEIKVMLQGQMVTIAAGSILDTSGDDDYVLYVTPAGVLTLTTNTLWGSAAAGSVPIWSGTLTGTVWSLTKDLRWLGRSGNHFSIYVGSGMGADFTSLNDAANWISASGLDALKSNINYEIVIVGSVEVDATVTLPDGWILRGLGTQGADRSLIYTTIDFPVTSDVVVVGDNCIVKNLKIMWYRSTGSQNTDKAALSIGAGGVVENVTFNRNGTYVFGMNIHISAAAATTTDTTIRNCVFDRFAVAGIWAEGKARVRIEHSKFTCLAGIPSYHINLAPTNAIGDATSPAHTIVGCYFGSRTAVANIQVGGPNVLIDSCHGVLDDLRSNGPFIKIISAGTTQNKAGATIRNCLLESGYTALSIAIDNSALRLSVSVEDCNFVEFTGTCIDLACPHLHSSSAVAIDGCLFKGHTSDSEVAIATNVSGTRVTNNKFYAYILYCIHVDSAVKAVYDLQVINNLFVNCCWKTITVGAFTDTQASVIMLEADKVSDQSISEVVISGNSFSTITGSAIRGHGDVGGITISGNIFDYVKGIYLYDDGAAKADKYAVVAMDIDGGGSGWGISNNRFTNCGDNYTIEVAPMALICHIIYLNSTAGGAPVIVDGNEFGDSIASGATADVNDLWRTIGIYADTDVVCSNNSFYRDIGNDRPRYGFTFILVAGASVVMSSCTFRLIGAATGLLANVQCVSGSGTLVATGCYTYCDFSTNMPDNRMWYGVGGSIVVGCYFKGGTTYASPANTVDLALGAGGMVACNVFSGAGTVTTGDNPVGYLPAFNPEV
jgi:hypothetical protein